jgi:FkbM family methyltransferase
MWHHEGVFPIFSGHRSSSVNTAKIALQFWRRHELQTRIPRGGWRVEKTLRNMAGRASIQIDGYRRLVIDLRIENHEVNDLLDHEPLSEIPYEPHIQAFCRRFLKPGYVVYDIGANLGLHTILFEKLCSPDGRVCAFEPNPGLLSSLQETFAHSTIVKVFGHALGNENTVSKLFIPEDHAQASLGNWKGNAKAIPCQIKRIDDLVSAGELPPPDFIKVDVEGAEFLVLGGAEQTLRRHRPIVVFEELKKAEHTLGLESGSAVQMLEKLPGYRMVLTPRQGSIIPIPAERPDWCELAAIPEERWTGDQI